MHTHDFLMFWWSMWVRVVFAGFSQGAHYMQNTDSNFGSSFISLSVNEVWKKSLSSVLGLLMALQISKGIHSKIVPSLTLFEQHIASFTYLLLL